jgi:hypothetical protein
MKRFSLIPACLLLSMHCGVAVADIAPRRGQVFGPLAADQAAPSRLLLVKAHNGLQWSPLLQSSSRGLVERSSVGGRLSDGGSRSDPGCVLQQLGSRERPLTPIADSCTPGTAVPILDLPPPPSSATLAVSGLLGVAGVQILRSGREWHFGVVPDWHHVAGMNGASQFALLVVPHFAASVSVLANGLVERQRLHLLLTRAFNPGESDVPCPRPQQLLPASSPRAPPL